MKKLICALLGLFISVSAFADGIKGTTQYKSVSNQLWVPREFFLSVFNDNGEWQHSSNAADWLRMQDAMLAKFDELAESVEEDLVIPVGQKKFEIVPSLQASKPLTWDDLNAICYAGGLTTEELCNKYVVNPLRTKFNRVRFYNVCESRSVVITQDNLHSDFSVPTGGVNHCVDDVFVKDFAIRRVYDVGKINPEERGDYSWNFHSDDQPLGGTKIEKGIGKSSSRPYAQDVRLPEWTAIGFAIEYARKNGHKVVCDTHVINNWINCTSFDNKHYYTFKFAETKNDSDSTIEENLIKGICAMFDAEYVSSGFQGITSDHAWGLKINTTSEDMCVMDCAYGSFEKSVIGKFNLVSSELFTHLDYLDKPGNYTVCKMHMLEGSNMFGDDSVNYYDEEHKDMTTAFENVQAVIDVALIDILKKYVQGQGIEVKSFNCDYIPIRYQRYDTVAGTLVPVSDDEKLTCHLNGKPVDFIFDDLYESKEFARKAGYAGMACLTAPVDLAKVLNEKFTTKFDGKSCIGPNKKLCLGYTDKNGNHVQGLNDVVPGGTEWDEDADRCVLNYAATAATINLVVNLVVDGVVLVVTIVSGAGLVVITVVGVSTIGVTLGSEALDRFMATRPNKYAKEFVEKASKCEISEKNKIENNTCSVKQTTCAKGVLKEFFGTMNFILDGISDEQAKYVTDVVGSLSNCVSESDGEKIVQEADVKTGLKTAQAASILLMAVGFANPNGATKFTLFSRFPKIMKWIGKVNDIRLSRFKIGKNLYKIQLDGSITADKLNSYIKEMETHGYSGVLFHDAKTGEQYWQVFVKGSQDEFNMLKYRASENFDKYLDEFLKTGKSKGLLVERLSPEEWNQLNKQLLKQDVQLRDTWSEGKQVMVFEKIGEVPVWNVGDVLIKNLENAGIHPHVISKGFFQVNYRTGQQCQTGLKFHVSVNIEDLQEASFIVDDLVRKSNVADIWKVGTNGMGGSQLGKDFTIYVSQDGYDINKIQGFLNELESRLKSKNIRSNGYGSNIRTGDKPVPGSNYINYRYDRIDNNGVPIDEYNGDYVFVAPRPEYGGDIMTGVRDISGSGGANVHIPDGTGAGGTGAAGTGTAGTGKSKMGRVIPVGTAAAGVYIASKIIGGGKDDDVTTDPNTDVGTPSDVVDFNESDVSPDGKINIRTDDNSTNSGSGTDYNSTSSGSGTDDGPSIGGNTDVDNSSGHSVQDSLDVMMNILGGN